MLVVESKGIVIEWEFLAVMELGRLMIKVCHSCRFVWSILSQTWTYGLRRELINNKHGNILEQNYGTAFIMCWWGRTRENYVMMHRLCVGLIDGQIISWSSPKFSYSFAGNQESPGRVRYVVEKLSDPKVKESFQEKVKL